MSDKTQPNFLFIMCDQLRWDYLSCYGHPYLHTPNIDRLARDGVAFDRAYCQAALCGPSRASFYTGRYMSSHGAMTNDDPLKLGELTLGDYLGELGYRTALVGKTHTSYSVASQQRLGLKLDTDQAKRLACGGFEPFEVHEGLYPDPIVPEQLGYNEFLVASGFDSQNPWGEYANSSINEQGEVVDGWLLRNNHLCARVSEPYSETAFATNRATKLARSNDSTAINDESVSLIIVLAIADVIFLPT